MSAAGWHPDPGGQYQYRYWDGAQWTDHVATDGVQMSAPLPAAPAQQTEQVQAEQVQSPAVEQPAVEQPAEQSWAAQVDPVVAETPVVEAEPVVEPIAEEPTVVEPVVEPVVEEPAAVAPPVVQAPPIVESAPVAAAAPAWGGAAGAGDPFAGLSGDLVSGTFAEVSGTGPQLQNSRLLRVRIDEPFMAKQGAMVGYQGAVDFAYQGGGAARFIKKALTGEGLSLMKVSGAGDVFLADTAKHVHILHLTNGGLSVSGSAVLAFSANLEWNVERVKGGSMAAGGLFNTTLKGTGWVAITTDGVPVVLNAGEAPTYADANALVAWSLGLQTSIKSSVSAGALIGRGSGEAFQVTFAGAGFVIIQPSEGYPVPTGAS